MVWNDKVKMGIKEIDAQHKQLFALINKAYASLGKKPKSSSDFENILRELLEYVRIHLTTEDFYKFDYEGTAEHLREQANMIQAVLTFKGRFERGEDINPELFNFLKIWWESHLKVMDRKYVKCFKEHGLK